LRRSSSLLRRVNILLGAKHSITQRVTCSAHSAERPGKRNLMDE
jgi:hypothetical protein